MFIIFLVVSLVSLRPQLARDVWCLRWRAGDALRTAGIGVRGVIPSLDTLTSSVMCYVLPSMDICNITPFPPHCQYLVLGIPLLYGLIGEGTGRWVQVASHLTRSHSHSLPNKPDQVPDLYMKYKRTRIQHAHRTRSYELPPLKK